MQKLHWISPLPLQNKLGRAGAPNSPDSFGKMGGNQWDALRASHQKIGLLSESLIMVPGARIGLATYRSSFFGLYHHPATNFYSWRQALPLVANAMGTPVKDSLYTFPASVF